MQNIIANKRGCIDHQRHWNNLQRCLHTIMTGYVPDVRFITSLVVCGVRAVLENLRRAIRAMRSETNYLALTIMPHCPGRNMMDPGTNPIVVDEPFECDQAALMRDHGIKWGTDNQVGFQPSLPGMYTVYFTRQVAEYAIMRSCEIFGTR
jgi:hypothetical protein